MSYTAIIRPPCPAPSSRGDTTRAAWARDKEVARWRARYETYDEYVARTLHENSLLRKKPKKKYRQPDTDKSLQAYGARLKRAPDRHFHDLRDACLSAYRVPDRVETNPMANPQAYPMHLLLLWNECTRRGYSPAGIVSHVSNWIHHPVTGKRVRVFKVPLQPDARRVFIGRTLKVQDNIGHPLSFGTVDHVYGDGTGHIKAGKHARTGTMESSVEPDVADPHTDMDML